jgi:hypothetical protein
MRQSITSAQARGADELIVGHVHVDAGSTARMSSADAEQAQRHRRFIREELGLTVG